MIGRNLENSGGIGRKKKAILIASVFIGLIAISALIFGLWVKNTLYSPNSGSSEKKQFVVESGQSLDEISSNLQKEGIIKSRFVFALYLKYKGKAGSIQAGDYQIAGNLNIVDVCGILTYGNITSGRITIPEGWTISQIGAYLEKNNIVKKVAFTEAAKYSAQKDGKYAFLAGFTEGESLEGFLYPDTYEVAKDVTADDIVAKMLGNFDKKFTTSMRDKVKTSGLNTYEVITLASIVEREVSKAEDRKLVASVFLNRLNADMPLESCATIQYVLGVSKMQFTYEETRTPSPYNTYINPGLPKGPIGNPSIDSIEAVLYPEKSNYYYFLSSKGTTYFSKTLDEHNAKKAQYLD